MSKRSERTLAFLIVAGIGMVLVGIPVLVAGLGGAGVSGRRGGEGMMAVGVVGILLILAGILTTGFAVFSGLFIGKREYKGLMRVDPHTRVIARYALNKKGDPVINDWEYEDPTTQYYVRLMTSDQRTGEYRCVPAVYNECGEGLIGEARLQGHWLGSFRPYVGGVPAPPSYSASN